MGARTVVIKSQIANDTDKVVPQTLGYNITVCQPDKVANTKSKGSIG
jgi:hypothetical protein